MLQKEMPSWKGNVGKLTRRYEEWLQETLSEELDHISKTEYKLFLGTLKKVHASLSRSLETFRGLLNQNIEKVLGLKLAEADWKIEVFVNLSRLAAQWEERINKAIEGMKKQALKYVQDELATIEALLSRAQGQTEEIQRTIEELKEQLEWLAN